MLNTGTTITYQDPLNNDYCLKLPGGFAHQIIPSPCMQKMLQPATPYTLADAMEIGAEYSALSTSHPAVTAKPVNHGPYFVSHNTATVPTPVGPEPLDLTAADANTRCYRRTGCAHEVPNCVTPDTWECYQPCRARTGENCRDWMVTLIAPILIVAAEELHRGRQVGESILSRLPQWSMQV